MSKLYVLQHCLSSEADLGVGVVGASEVGLVRLLEALARALREVFVIVENAAGRICCQVDFLLKADICQIQHAQHIHPDGLQLHSTACNQQWTRYSAPAE